MLSYLLENLLLQVGDVNRIDAGDLSLLAAMEADDVPIEVQRTNSIPLVDDSDAVPNGEPLISRIKTNRIL